MIRVQWLIAPAGRWIGWELRRADMVMGAYFTKRAALKHARAERNDEWHRYGLRSELKVMGRDGQFTAEGSTYGHDPVETKG